MNGSSPLQPVNNRSQRKAAGRGNVSPYWTWESLPAANIRRRASHSSDDVPISSFGQNVLFCRQGLSSIRSVSSKQEDDDNSVPFLFHCSIFLHIRFSLSGFTHHWRRNPISSSASHPSRPYIEIWCLRLVGQVLFIFTLFYRRHQNGYQ